MSDQISIRKATEKDIAFLAEAVIEAEKSGTDRLSYSTIFGMREEDVRSLLPSILEEDITGQELCISGFLIAEAAGEYAGAVCAWIEGASGNLSSRLKADVLAHFMGRERIINAARYASLLNAVHIERENGALQLETVYTCNKYRGQGVSGTLINEHIRLYKTAFPGLNKAQILLAKTNDSAYKAYHKPGFTTVLEKHCPDAAILQVLPSDTMILMEKLI